MHRLPTELLLALLLLVNLMVSNGFVPDSFVGARVQKRSQSSYREMASDLNDKAHKIMLNQQTRKREDRRYQIIAAEAAEPLARRLEETYPERFTYHPTKWGKFSDGTDNIEIGGFTPRNLVSGEHVLFLASFHNNDVTLSQFQVMISLLFSFIESMTVVLPYSPVGKLPPFRIASFRRLFRHIGLTTPRYYGSGRSGGASCHGCYVCPHVLIPSQLWTSHTAYGV